MSVSVSLFVLYLRLLAAKAAGRFAAGVGGAAGGFGADGDPPMLFS